LKERGADVGEMRDPVPVRLRGEARYDRWADDRAFFIILISIHSSKCEMQQKLIFLLLVEE